MFKTIFRNVLQRNRSFNPIYLASNGQRQFFSSSMMNFHRSTSITFHSSRPFSSESTTKVEIDEDLDLFAEPDDNVHQQNHAPKVDENVKDEELKIGDLESGEDAESKSFRQRLKAIKVPERIVHIVDSQLVYLIIFKNRFNFLQLFFFNRFSKAGKP